MKRSSSWGRLAACGGLATRLSRDLWRAAMWGSQSWPQPPFRRLGERSKPAEVLR